MKILYTLLVSIIITSCSNSSEKTVELDNGNVIKYFYHDKSDTSNYTREFYYSNGVLGTLGGYKKGKMHGKWNWWYDNGNKKDIAYLNNGKYIKSRTHWYRNGALKMKETILSPCDGECCDSKVEIFDSLGRIKESYKTINNKIIDTFFIYWENGQIFKKVLYENGIKNGLYQEYFKNGQIWVNGSYHDGLRNGEWTWYDTTNNTSKVIRYNLGKKL